MANLDSMIEKLEAVNKLCDEILGKQNKIIANQKALLDSSVRLTLRDADSGQICPSCGGDGLSYPDDQGPEMCLRCDGTGQI